MPPKPDLTSDQRKQIVSQLVMVKATTLMVMVMAKVLVMRKIYRQCMWVQFIDNTCSIQLIPFPANVA
jgi:hypothetical protein